MIRTGVARASALALLAFCGAGLYAQQKQPSAPSREVTLTTVLAIEDNRAATRADLDLLLSAARGRSGDAALRALGRLQRRDVIPDLLPYVAGASTRATAALAAGLALRGPALDGVPDGQHESAVLGALVTAGDLDLASTDPVALTSISRSLGHLPYVDIDSFKTAETFLRKVLERPFPKLFDAPHIGAARGLESLARLNRKLATLDDVTIEWLRTAARTIDPRRAAIQRNALAALIAAQAVDADTLEAVLGGGDQEVRRLAILALAGAGSAIAEEDRIGYIRKALSDSSYVVRLEALRAWARRGVKDHGCQPLLDALSDKSTHVVLMALDLLGDACRDDGVITIRLASESRTPRPLGTWQREMHAFVALAKRDRERAMISLLPLAMHQTWQVRMYAARAAAILGDVPVLTRLASDAEDNVAEATLPTLRRLTGAESDQLFINVLNRRTTTSFGPSRKRPYEIIRTAAMTLENATPTPALVGALVGALERITAEVCQTSRDTRLALIARLAQLGTPEQVETLLPLLRDIDPEVAAAAATVIQQWTGMAVDIKTPLVKSPVPTAEELAKRVRVVFEMDNGRKFDVALNAETPLTRSRFLAAVGARYYNGLTFHRVVPNFIIQGGSPGANEYCGDCPFMRDEVGLMHERGTLGISTRGPDTGDAQIFINLVDNPRLDFDYTAFARVCSGMSVVDDIKEGDRIVRVEVLPATPTCGG